jgi:hypothetical protein
LQGGLCYESFAEQQNLISKLALINHSIAESHGIDDLKFLILNPIRILLMRAIIKTYQNHVICRKSGWNITKGGLKGGMPGDFSFANESSNSEDFTFANSDSEDLVEEEKGSEVKVDEKNILSVLPSVIYPPVLNSSVTYPDPDLPSIQCSKFCNNQCITVLQYWSSLEKQEIRMKFSQCDKTQMKNKLLDHLLFQKSAGLPVSGFFFNGHLLCANIFSYIAEISKYHVRLVTRDFTSGYQRYIHGNSNRRKNLAARVSFISWMKVFSENYGQNGPTGSFTI